MKAKTKNSLTLKRVISPSPLCTSARSSLEHVNYPLPDVYLVRAPRGDSDDVSWVFEIRWYKYCPQGQVSTLETYLSSTFLEEEYNPYAIYI